MRRTIVASLQMSDEPFFCVFATYCSLCFQICIIPVLRECFRARVYARASGGFCFLPSLLHPYALSCWPRERKGWRLLSFSLHTLFTHSGGTVKVRRDLSLHPKMIEIVCVVVGRWRVKAKSENSVSAYARVSGAKASPAVFTRGEQKRGVSRFSGGKTRESAPLFSFCLEFFRASIDRWSRGVGRWEEIGVRDGNRFALWFMGCGCSEYSAVRRKTQRATLHNGVARCLVAVRSSLCFLSTPERKPPCSSSGYENLWDESKIVVFNRL